MAKKDQYSPEALQFGAMLSKYRFLQPNGKNLTQKDVADKCDISVSTYSKYEQGVFLPDTDRVLLLGKELCIPPAELLSTAYPEYMDYFSNLPSFPYPIPAELSNEILKSISIETYTDDNERLSRLFQVVIDYALKINRKK